MNAEIEDMARNFFGYGRWDAPYRFIGPEQGGDDNPTRSLAFIELQKEKPAPDGLCDCLEFHRTIKEGRWHFKDPIDLQWTWKKLMLLLMTFLQRPSDDASLCKYQSDCWGRSCGETCVVELSGLSFKSFRESGDFRKETNDAFAATWRGFRRERVKTLRDNIRDGKPQLVVLYGYSHERFWKEIAGDDLPLRGTAKRAGSTVFVYGPHPASYGNVANSDNLWCNLGHSARELMQ
jgi:hypothetical protein